jgi:hypothetical protein
VKNWVGKHALIETVLQSEEKKKQVAKLITVQFMGSGFLKFRVNKNRALIHKFTSVICWQANFVQKKLSF